MCFAAELAIELIGRAAVLGERQVRVAKEFRRRLGLFVRINHLGLDAGNPLHRTLIIGGRDLNAARDGHWSLHRPVNLVQPVSVRHQRCRFGVIRLVPDQPGNRRCAQREYEREKERLAATHYIYERAIAGPKPGNSEELRAETTRTRIDTNRGTKESVSAAISARCLRGIRVRS